MGCMDRFPARKATPGEDCGYGTPGAYLSAFFFALVVSSLLSIVKAMEDPFSLSGPDDVISSFAFEANALLQLIEEKKPGSLNSFPKTWEEGFSKVEILKGEKARSTSQQDQERLQLTLQQGAVEDEEDPDGGDGV